MVSETELRMDSTTVLVDSNAFAAVSLAVSIPSLALFIKFVVVEGSWTGCATGIGFGFASDILGG